MEWFESWILDIDFGSRCWRIYIEVESGWGISLVSIIVAGPTAALTDGCLEASGHRHARHRFSRRNHWLHLLLKRSSERGTEIEERISRHRVTLP